MYESHWGFDRPPLTNALDVRRFFASPMHEEALARLHFLAAGARQLGVLVGDWGTGKSLLLEVFAHELRRQGYRVAKSDALGLEAEEWLMSVAVAWDLNPEPGCIARRLWAMLADRMATFRYEGVRAAVLLDNADEAPHELLVQLTRLIQSETIAESRLTTALAVRTGRIGCLDRRLLELTDLRIELGPWDVGDTHRFIEQALSLAGRKTPAFEPAALDRLHELAHGVPRRVQQLAELALVASAGCRLPLVDVHTVETTFDELAVPLGEERIHIETM
jgi:type II secretory pathway predicted ATPase ExeA